MSIPLKKLMEGMTEVCKVSPEHLDGSAMVVFQVNGCAVAYEIAGMVAAEYEDSSVLLIMAGPHCASVKMDLDKIIAEDQISWGTIN